MWAYGNSRIGIMRMVVVGKVYVGCGWCEHVGASVKEGLMFMANGLRLWT